MDDAAVLCALSDGAVVPVAEVAASAVPSAKVAADSSDRNRSRRSRAANVRLSKRQGRDVMLDAIDEKEETTLDVGACEVEETMPMRLAVAMGVQFGGASSSSGPAGCEFVQRFPTVWNVNASPFVPDAFSSDGKLIDFG